MVDYEHIHKEVKLVKEKSDMTDVLMNYSNVSTCNGQCKQNKFARVPSDDKTYINHNIPNMMRRKKIDEHTTEFLQSSTLHGLHFCFDKRYKFRRLFWIVLVGFSVGLLLQKLYESTMKFFDYPFSTTTTIAYIDDIDFPAISICNMNDFRMSKMKGTKLNSLLQNMGSFDEIIDQISGEEYAYTIKGANHKLKDMLYECSMLDEQCTEANFSTFYQTQGEKCHTFNSGEMEIIKVNGTGTKKSFDIKINIEHYDYTDAKDAGIRLIIHDQNETPVRMTGIALGPGFTSYIRIMKTKTINLKKPYATACGAEPLKYFKHYSENTCWVERLTDYVVKKCGCKDGFMPGPAKVCSLKELTSCTWPKWEEFNDLKHINCPIACEVINFQPLLSFAQFPANKHADSIAKHMNLTGSVQENRKFIRDNFLRVIIYYEHMSYIRNEQTPSYDLMILLGDTGGQLGLFLGTSILTYVEFFDLLAMVIYTKYFEIFKPKARM